MKTILIKLQYVYASVRNIPEAEGSIGLV